MADPSQPTLVDEYRNAAAAIRDNAKWGLKTLGAVAAALIAGLGLSSLANVHSTEYLVMAVGGIALALVGVGGLFYLTTRILDPSTASLATTIAAKKDMKYKYWYLKPILAAEGKALDGLAKDFEELQTKAEEAASDYSKALLDNYAEKTGASARNAEAAAARTRLYEQTVEAIEAQAGYRELASRAHPLLQLLAGAAVAIGVGIFAVALALPTDPKPDFHGAQLTGVDLAGTRLIGADFSELKLTSVSLRDADLRRANFDGTTLRAVSFLGADLKGASFKQAHWIGTTCPDGADSDLAGNTCEHHMEVLATVADPTPTSKSRTPPHGLQESSQRRTNEHRGKS